MTRGVPEANHVKPGHAQALPLKSSRQSFLAHQPSAARTR
jgi:hypothetical protein